MAFFTELEQQISHFIWKHERPWIAKAVLRKKNGAGGIKLSDFRLYYRATVIKNSMVLTQKQKYRQKEQDRKPRNKPTHLWVPCFWQRKQEHTMGQESLFNKWCWENWTLTCKRNKWEHFLTPHTKINSKWIKDLHVRPESVKLLEENIGRTLNDINQSKILYNPPPRVMEIKIKVNKWGLIKLRSFCTAKETTSKVKRQPSEWEKIIANETTEKGLISKIYK